MTDAPRSWYIVPLQVRRSNSKIKEIFDSNEFFLFAFKICTWYMHSEPRPRFTVVQSSVVSRWSGRTRSTSWSWLKTAGSFFFDWLEPRWRLSKLLAETVCFHMEDFGKAGSLLQSLEEKDKRGTVGFNFPWRPNILLCSFHFLLAFFFLSISNKRVTLDKKRAETHSS